MITRGFTRGLAIFGFLVITCIMGLLIFGDITIGEKIVAGVIWLFFTLLMIPIMSGSTWDWVEANRDRIQREANLKDQ